MRHGRVSIAGLMGLVGVVAIGLVGLRMSTPIWAATTFTLTLMALLGALVSALFARGRRRGFAVGFTLFGATTLALSLGPLSLHKRDAPALIFAPLAELAYAKLHPTAESAQLVGVWRAASDSTGILRYSSQPATGTSTGPDAVISVNSDRSAPPPALVPPQPMFVRTAIASEQIGLSLGALMLALIGGFWGAREQASRHRSLEGSR